MGKAKHRHERCRCPVFTGAYTARNKTNFSLAKIKTKLAKMKLWDKIKCYIYDWLDIMVDNYTITMIVVLMLLSLFIPFVTKAIHDSSETKALRKMVNAITKEVAQAQTDYEEVVDEFSLLQSSMHDVQTAAQNSLHYCESCQRVMLQKSQAVQANSKKNFFDRLIRSVRGFPEQRF